MKGYVVDWIKWADTGTSVGIYQHPTRGCETPVLLVPDDGSQVVVSREEWEAVRALVAALDTCKPAIDGAFTMAHIHGHRYSGPTYNEELERVRALLGTNGDTHDD